MLDDGERAKYNLKHGSVYAAGVFTHLALDKLRQIGVFFKQLISYSCEMFPPFFASIHMMDCINGFFGYDRQSQTYSVCLLLWSCHRPDDCTRTHGRCEGLRR